MTTPVGGLRARLIKESMYRMVDTALEDLGWYADDSWFSPINLIPEQIDDQTEIVPNVVAISDDDDDNIELEMGSNLTEFRWTYWIDVYGENNAVALHIGRDIRDFLQGRMPSIGRGSPSLTVLDYTLATPTELFTCELENISLNRAHDFPKEYQKYWYSIYVELVDSYGDENDD